MDFSEANKIKNVYNNKYEVCTVILVSCIGILYFVFATDFFRAFIYSRHFFSAIIDMGLVAVNGIISIVLFPLSLSASSSVGSQIRLFFYFILGIIEISTIISVIFRKIYLELSKA